MAQHDMVIDNGPGITVRTDINAALLALVSQNAGAVEPTTKYPGMPWLDTTVAPNGQLKQRNLANTAWVDPAFGGTVFTTANSVFAYNTGTTKGHQKLASGLIINFGNVVSDASGNCAITFSMPFATGPLGISAMVNTGATVPATAAYAITCASFGNTSVTLQVRTINSGGAVAVGPSLNVRYLIMGY